MTTAKRILIVDDEEDLAWGMSKSLSRCRNLDVRCAYDGNQALALMDNERFDLVISDLRMPGRNGFELIREIRESYPATRVIVMTAYGSEEVMERADDFGSFFYIEKPFDMGYLKQTVFSALGLSQAGFEGSVQHAGIRELVELNCFSRKDSTLWVSRRQESGAIYFRNGDVVHAECGELVGERAFYNILNWDGGRFKIRPGSASIKRTIRRDWRSLLHQCQQV
ncbi:MAG: response regulator [Calditrichaeota bacterium]|nr:MAG: response regulator [Calditrichota bacterium]